MKALVFMGILCDWIYARLWQGIRIVKAWIAVGIKCDMKSGTNSVVVVM